MEGRKDRMVFLDAESFGPLLPFIQDETITDVDFNGADLWLTTIDKVRKKVDASRSEERRVGKECAA